MRPRQAYLVCATPRSGSTLFCEALNHTSIAGRPNEYFEALKETGLPRQPSEYFEMPEDAAILDILGRPSRRVDHAQLARWRGPAYADYLAKILEAGTTPNGVFGAKMMWGYFDDFISHLRQIPLYKDMEVHDLLSTIFPNLQYIWITRHNKERQAVSLWKAIQTQQWREELPPSSTNDSLLSTRKLVFSFSAIAHLEQQIVTYEMAWQQYFKAGGIQPLIVVYEELLEAYEVTVCKALQYLTITPPENQVFAMPPIQRQADALSEEWIQHYHSLKREK
jgi:trehalose 2-sulfotransferase